MDAILDVEVADNGLLDEDVKIKIDEYDGHWAEIFEDEDEAALNARLAKNGMVVSITQKRKEIKQAADQHSLTVFFIKAEDMATPLLQEAVRSSTSSVLRFCTQRHGSGYMECRGLLQLVFPKMNIVEEYEERFKKWREGTEVHRSYNERDAVKANEGWFAFHGPFGLTKAQDMISLYIDGLSEDVTVDDLWEILPLSNEIWHSKEFSSHAYVTFRNDEAFKETVKTLKERKEAPAKLPHIKITKLSSAIGAFAWDYAQKLSQKSKKGRGVKPAGGAAGEGAPAAGGDMAAGPAQVSGQKRGPSPAAQTTPSQGSPTPQGAPGQAEPVKRSKSMKKRQQRERKQTFPGSTEGGAEGGSAPAMSQQPLQQGMMPPVNMLQSQQGMQLMASLVQTLGNFATQMANNQGTNPRNNPGNSFGQMQTQNFGNRGGMSMNTGAGESYPPGEEYGPPHPPKKNRKKKKPQRQQQTQGQPIPQQPLDYQQSSYGVVKMETDMESQWSGFGQRSDWPDDQGMNKNPAGGRNKRTRKNSNRRNTDGGYDGQSWSQGDTFSQDRDYTGYN